MSGEATGPKAEERPTTRPGHTAFVVTLLIGLPLALLLIWPQAFGVQRLIGVAQLIAFRAPWGIGLAALAVVAAIVALLRRRWGIAAGVAISLALAAATDGAVLLQRGASSAPAKRGDLTVLSWNTQGGATSPEEVARLVLETGADVVSLPETDERAAAEIAGLVAAEGRPMTAGTTRGEDGTSQIPTSVLIADALGGYRIDAEAGSTPGLPSAVWRPVDAGGPTIVTAHPYPPLPSSMDAWRAGLDWVAAQCTGADTILAGDLNATVDHLWGLGSADALVGGCRDAALEVGAAGVGTWPSTRPAWIAAPIDHVLVGSGWRVRGVEVVETSGRGSDHRPIVAVLDAR